MNARSALTPAPSAEGGVALGPDLGKTLVIVNVVLFALLLLHDLDHVLFQREPTSGPGGTPLYAWAVSFAGYAGLLLAVGLALRADRRAPLLTQALGLGFAVGFVVAHALPLGPGSYWAYKPGAVSWALVIAPTVAGLAAAAVGRRALRPSTSSG